MGTISKHARFFMLLKQLPYYTKEELVWEYSNMATTSLSEFHASDLSGYNQMISDMQNTLSNMDNSNKTDPEIKKLRSAILHRLQKYGIDTTDWHRVNSFLENPRIAGKRLYDLSKIEMQNLIPKMEKILHKDQAERDEIKRLTQLN